MRRSRVHRGAPVSVWDRMRGLFGGKVEDEEAPAAATPSAGAPPSAAPSAAQPEQEKRGPIAALRAQTDAAAIDEPSAIEALDAAAEQGQELLAIDLCRRLLTRGDPLPELRLRLAERLLARGDELDAETLVAPLAADPNGALPAWMLAAELAERRGDRAAARALYERIVARDLSFPRAKERAARLREADVSPRRDAGATLMADGASTRRFRLREELGRGGAGTVFLAEEPALDRVVALKVYHRRGRADRERLLAEARSAAAFSHPGIVRILDVDETLGAIAMEPLLAGSVRTRMERGASASELRLLLAGVVEALRYVHAAGVVHCDLKPSNFLVREAEGALPPRGVLTDFGLARPIGAAPREKGEGTLAFMSPEQRGAQPAHPAMDVFAMGISIQRLLPPSERALHALGKAMCSADPSQRPALGDLLRALERP